MITPDTIYEYDGQFYPDYLKRGNAMQFIQPAALHFCTGFGVDVGCGVWPLAGAQPIDAGRGHDACNLPREFDGLDFVFSSHCLEHLEKPTVALQHWVSRLKVGGVLFLYLPHPDMRYWRPDRCPKHRHVMDPPQVRLWLDNLGLGPVLMSGRDLAWSFSAVGFKQ